MVNLAMTRFHSLLRELASRDKSVSIEKSRASNSCQDKRGLIHACSLGKKQTLGSWEGCWGGEEGQGGGG